MRLHRDLLRCVGRASRISLGVILLALWSPPELGAAPPASARDYVASVRPSPALQAFLDRTLDDLAARDPALRRVRLHAALLDLGSADSPALAHHRGEIPVYPASVVKFVYLMAAYAWHEQGRLPLDDGLDRLLTDMIRVSSNQATQQVVARLTGTEPGPALADGAYREFRTRRHAVKRWLESLGITDLHCVHPTYDGNGDLFGRDVQFLRDRSVAGGLGGAGGQFPNRQAMTAIDTAELLALLATDRALSPEGSAVVRRRMRRNPAEQPYQRQRIAGGAARLPGVETYSKTGTWGPIFADAGIVRHESGRQMVLVVFTDGSPPYRGDFIADLAHRSAQHLLMPP